MLKMHKKAKNSAVIAKNVVSSQRFSYITHVMETESVRLKVLEDALDKRLDICSSEGSLTVFPKSLLSSYLVDYIGIIVCIDGFFSFEVNEEPGSIKAGETLFLTENVRLQIKVTSDNLRYYLLFYRIEKIIFINRFQEEILHLKPQALSCILKIIKACKHDHTQFRY